MSDLVILELYLSREQPVGLSLAVPHDSLTLEIIAEGLYAAKRHWRDPERAAPIIIRKMAKFYDTRLVVGARRIPGADVVVIDFVSRLISDRTEEKSYKFSGWLAKYGVPE